MKHLPFLLNPINSKLVMEFCNSQTIGTKEFILKSYGQVFKGSNRRKVNKFRFPSSRPPSIIYWWKVNYLANKAKRINFKQTRVVLVDIKLKPRTSRIIMDAVPF